MNNLLNPTEPSDDLNTNLRYERDLWWRCRWKRDQGEGNYNSKFWSNETPRLNYVLTGQLPDR